MKKLINDIIDKVYPPEMRFYIVLLGIVVFLFVMFLAGCSSAEVKPNAPEPEPVATKVHQHVIDMKMGNDGCLYLRVTDESGSQIYVGPCKESI